MKQRTSYSYASVMALTALIVLILASLVVGFGRERRGIRFAEENAHG
jgi:hypothetical protein